MANCQDASDSITASLCFSSSQLKYGLPRVYVVVMDSRNVCISQDKIKSPFIRKQVLNRLTEEDFLTRRSYRSNDEEIIDAVVE